MPSCSTTVTQGRCASQCDRRKLENALAAFKCSMSSPTSFTSHANLAKARLGCGASATSLPAVKDQFRLHTRRSSLLERVRGGEKYEHRPGDGVRQGLGQTTRDVVPTASVMHRARKNNDGCCKKKKGNTSASGWTMKLQIPISILMPTKRKLEFDRRIATRLPAAWLANSQMSNLVSLHLCAAQVQHKKKNALTRTLASAFLDAHMHLQSPATHRTIFNPVRQKVIAA